MLYIPAPAGQDIGKAPSGDILCAGGRNRTSPASIFPGGRACVFKYYARGRFSGSSRGGRIRSSCHRKNRSYDRFRSMLRYCEHGVQSKYSPPRNTEEGRRRCNSRFHGRSRNKPFRHARGGRQLNSRQQYRQRSRSAHAVRGSRCPVHDGRHALRPQRQAD